jgi:hypothetical protein
MNNGRYRTVIMYKGKTITAVGSTEKESQRLAQGKLKNLPSAVEKLSKDALSLKLIDYMPDWLHGKHVKKVAPTTYKRYVGLMEKWVLPSLGHIKVVELNKHHVNALMEYMDGKVGPRSQQQARALLSAAFANLVKREWILDNPSYNFNGLFNTHYSNTELYNYFEVYYQDLVFILDNYNKKNFLIKPSSIK